jgi:hypothetical protein
MAHVDTSFDALVRELKIHIKAEGETVAVPKIVEPADASLPSEQVITPSPVAPAPSTHQEQVPTAASIPTPTPTPGSEPSGAGGLLHGITGLEPVGAASSGSIPAATAPIDPVAVSKPTPWNHQGVFLQWDRLPPGVVQLFEKHGIDAKAAGELWQIYREHPQAALQIAAVELGIPLLGTRLRLFKSLRDALAS